MIKRLGHLCLKTAHYDRLVAFYRDTLGFQTKFTFEGRDGQTFGIYFDLGDRTFFEIFDQVLSDRHWGGGVAALQPNDNTYYQHFCIEVENLEGYRDSLLSKGVEVTPIRGGMDNSKQAWLKDPDGNRIELMEYTPASLQTTPGIHVAR